MALSLTEKQCVGIAKKRLAEANLYEATSGFGDDFHEALGKMLFDVAQIVYADTKLYVNTHIHTYAPPATVTGTVTIPMV